MAPFHKLTPQRRPLPPGDQAWVPPGQTRVVHIDLSVPEADVPKLVAIAEASLAGVPSPYAHWVPAYTTTAPTPLRAPRRRSRRDRGHLEVLDGGMSASG